MSQKERENFFRILCLVLDHTNEAARGLLELHLSQKAIISFEDFVRQNLHEIYHLCYNRRRCCQCYQGYVLPNQRVLSPVQIDILLDKHARKHLNHNVSNSGPEYCCSPVRANITVNVLDITLTNCLLINFCQDIFWYCCLAFTNQNFEQFLNNNRHRLYHFKYGVQFCCSCQSSIVPPNQEPISSNEWMLMFNTPSTRCSLHVPPTAHQRPVCAYAATNGIRESSVDSNTTRVIHEQLCDCRQHLKTLVSIRNKIAHAYSGLLSDNDYEALKIEIETGILQISIVCNQYDVMKDKLQNVEKRSLDEQLCFDYHNLLLKHIQTEKELSRVLVDDMPRIIQQSVEDVSNRSFLLIRDGFRSIEARIQNNEICRLIGDDSYGNEEHNVERKLTQTFSDNDFNLNINDTEVNGKWLNLLNSTVNILDKIRFVCPQLSAIHDLAVFAQSFCEGYQNEGVQEVLEAFLEEQMDEEYEGNKQLFVNAIIFMSATGLRKMNKVDVQTVFLTMNPLQSVVFLGKIWQRIENFKKNCRRRDFETFMKYVVMYTNLAYLRYTSLLYLYGILEINDSPFLKGVRYMLDYQKKQDTELLEFFVKPRLSTVKFNFMFSPVEYPSVEKFLKLQFGKDHGLDYLREGEYIIQPIEYEDSYLYFANIACTWLRWSYYRNSQSLVKFTKHTLEGKTYFQIFSVEWPEHYARMGNDGWWVRGYYSNEVDNYGLWEVVQLHDEIYSDGDYFMLAPKDSRANFISVDGCGRIYGPRCEPGSYGIFKIEPVYYDAEEEITKDDGVLFYDAVEEISIND